MDSNFFERILRVTGFDHCDEVWWRDREGTTTGEIAMYAQCNDLFYWGTSDLEEITEDNIDAFEQAYADMAAINPPSGGGNAGLLFCARVRKQRPQGAYYKYFTPAERELFDVCGPEREVGLGNPRSSVV